MAVTSAERLRVSGENRDIARWRKWGPYLSDRAWGTVREDYSADGDAWSYFPHDHARSKAYRWGEDGICGFSDRYQILCFSMAFWNERDAILKERYFGVVPAESNHGEDVKEYYFYADALPSHAYQRMVYKYPQRAFPYAQLVEESRRRTSHDPEYELLDTGIFDNDRYFDVEMEVAKQTPDDLWICVTAHNRGDEAAPLHLVPHLWFRKTWDLDGVAKTKPSIRAVQHGGRAALLADDSDAPPLDGLLADTRLGPHLLEFVDSPDALHFTDNETNCERLYGTPSRSRYVKDAFHRRIIHGEAATNPDQHGTKACAQFRRDVPAHGSVTIVMRLAPVSSTLPPLTLTAADELFAQRRDETDEFYATIHHEKASADERNVQRQALAGMLWSKQSYLFDVDVWLDGDAGEMPPPPERKHGRNSRWRHLNSMRILSMPDKWEYPWFAGWDLAFHAVTLTLVDAEWAKEQVWLLLFEQFQHPNGQIPAYEWEFSDLNPPVQAWAVWRVYNMDRIRSGKADREFLERCFHKLMLNFTWWVNKVDREGHNVFEGGFLGLDNITLIDRSERFAEGAVLEQSDATGWMGMFCLVMMRIALELSKQAQSYEWLATKFFEHYVYIGAAMKIKRNDHRLWNEEDGFFYDILRMPDGTAHPFRVRSLVGLIPLYAIERLESDWIEPFPMFAENFRWFFTFRKALVENCVSTVENEGRTTHVLSVLEQDELHRLLARVIDPGEFLSPYGMRSLSKHHEQHPFRFNGAEVRYEPAEAEKIIKGGNSNWRGPVWLPTTFLMVETLRKLEKAYGGQLVVTLTDGTTRSLSDLGRSLAKRTISIFTRDEEGYRPLFGPRGTRKAERFANDPHWRDYLLFFEYFNGDTGEGLGASHQTGWTGLVANLIDEWR